MLHQIGEKKRTQVINIAWKALAIRCIKLNFDGASKNNQSLARCGGLCKGEDGNWITSFICNFGKCRPMVVELWGAIYSLKLAWDRGFKCIMLEIVDLLIKTNLNPYKNQTLIRKIKSYL